MADHTADAVRRQELADAAVSAAVEALRAWHLEQFGFDPTDPELLRRTATIALTAGMRVIWEMTSDNPAQYADYVAEEKRVPVLYLDLDGTVREGKDDALGRFVNGPEDVVVFPAAVEGMRRWKAAGGRVVGVSNQGGIALGIVTFEKGAAAVMETQRQCQGLFDRILFCQHHPKAADPEMARCWCRKPSAGAVVEAAHGLVERFPGEIYPPYMGLFVGDRDEDRQCAESAGLDFMWAAEWRAQFDGDVSGE